MPFDISCDLQSVGQTVAEAVETGSHRHYDTESGVSSTDEEKHSRKLENDTGAGEGTSLPRKDL